MKIRTRIARSGPASRSGKEIRDGSASNRDFWVATVAQPTHRGSPVAAANRGYDGRLGGAVGPTTPWSGGLTWTTTTRWLLPGKPGAVRDEPWEGDTVVKVGDKIFAFFGMPESGTIGLKCGKDADEAEGWRLEYPDDVTVMPYLGRYGWNTSSSHGGYDRRGAAGGDRHLLPGRPRPPPRRETPRPRRAQDRAPGHLTPASRPFRAQLMGAAAHCHSRCPVPTALSPVYTAPQRAPSPSAHRASAS